MEKLAKGNKSCPVVASGRIRGANERINVAVVGIRSRGGSHIKELGVVAGVNIKTIVDIDENLLSGALKRVKQTQPESDCVGEYDFRRVLDDKDVDAVSLATPNHWHALQTIWACQAGKDVYCEKPASHNVVEGRSMIKAARKYGRVVQIGFQSRSNTNVKKAIDFLHSGGIGDIYLGRGLCFKPRNAFPIYADGAMEAGQEYKLGRDKYCYDEEYLKRVHYDQWIGPAPAKPFNANRFHYNWHWQWEYGCGDIGNQGPHQCDIGRWGMGFSGHPKKINSVGGYFAFADCPQTTPNSQTAVFEYDDGRIFEFEVRGVYTNDEASVRIGNLFFGSKGWMQLTMDGKWKTYFGRKNEPGPGSESADGGADALNLSGSGGQGHFENFVKSIRSRKVEELNCDVESGHISTCMAHLANVSYRVGRELHFDGNLETFVNSKEANSLLTRQYRKPYVVGLEV